MRPSALFRFKPEREMFIVLASYLGVVSAIYLAFQVFTTQRVALNFIMFGGVGIILFGVGMPVYWTCYHRHRSLASLGITGSKWKLSLALGLLLTSIQYALTLRTISFPPFLELLPLATMALAVGLYENVFYRGWIQLRMETYFGLIPSVLISATLYALYHIGYGMLIGEMAFLFVVGLVYSIIFRLTKSIWIVYPFLTPTGAIFSQLKDGLSLPFGAFLGFMDVIVVCLLFLYFTHRFFNKYQAHVNDHI